MVRKIGGERNLRLPHSLRGTKQAEKVPDSNQMMCPRGEANKERDLRWFKVQTIFCIFVVSH